MHRVTWKDEWLAEAYMETDYSDITQDEFMNIIKNYNLFILGEQK